MRLESVLFASKSPARYERMADVLALSAAENSPRTPLLVRAIDGSARDLESVAYQGCKRLYLDNARKAAQHRRIIERAADGEVLGMLDADTMVLGDLAEIEGMDFDLAYTTRPHGSKLRLNTGVYFVRCSDALRGFCRQWFSTVIGMLTDANLHKHWRKTKHYGGIHQAALGLLLEAGPPIKLLELPCETWNCVSLTWQTSTAPKVVHIMGQMREWCFGQGKPRHENEKRLVDLWQGFDERCTQQRSAVA